MGTSQDGVSTCYCIRHAPAILKISKVPGCGIQNTTAKTVEQCKSETEDKIGMDLQQLNLSYLDLVRVLVGIAIHLIIVIWIHLP